MMPLNGAWNPELRDKKRLDAWLSISRGWGVVELSSQHQTIGSGALCCGAPWFSPLQVGCSRRQPRWLQLCSGCCWLTGLRAQGMMSPHIAMIALVARARYFVEMQPTSCWGMGMVSSYFKCPQFSVQNYKLRTFLFPVWCWPKCCEARNMHSCAFSKTIYVIYMLCNISGITFFNLVLTVYEVKVKMASSWKGKSHGSKYIMEAFFFFVA